MSFDLQPTLRSPLLELRPLRPDDFPQLYAAASDPLIWEQHPKSDRYKEEVFREYFRTGLESKGTLVVIDEQSGQIIGSSRYHGFDPQASQIEIGWTFLARSHWGGRFNGEMKRLMLDHAFKFVKRVVFIVGAENRRSRRALEKIGATDTGLKRMDQGVEHLVYEITAQRWKRRSHDAPAA